MALYKEQSADWLNNILATGEDNRRRQQLALYETQKDAAQRKYEDSGNGGLGGFLSNLTRDLKSAKNTLATTAAAYMTKGIQDANNAAMKDATTKGKEEQDRIAREYGYSGVDEAYDKGDGPDEMWEKLQNATKQTRQKVEKISDDYKNNWAIKQINNTKQSQYGADALRTLNLGFNLMAPGVASTVGGGALSGAVGGIADSLENADGTVLDLQARTSGGKIGNTEDATIDAQDMLKRAAIGAGVGAATAGVGNKIGNAKSTIGSKLLNNKLITSGVGRGATSGALGGALSSGTYAALEGGDVGNAALQGALSGGVSGGVAGGIMSGTKKAGSSVANKLGISDKLNAVKQGLTYDPERQAIKQVARPEEVAKTTTTADNLDIPDYTKPTDYQGNELKIEKKNVLQKLGKNLSKAGERIDNAELYNSLNAKTANEIVKNGTVDKLRKLGYKPEDYAEAAKISTTTNQFIDDIVKNSGATITDNNLVDRISNPSEGNIITNKQLAQEYKNQVNKTIDTLEKNSIPGKYNASDLLKESRRIGDLANKYYKQSKNANGGDNANERGILADALTDVKYELRNLASKSVDGFGDNYTKSQLTQRLKKLGATDAAIKDMTEAKNLGEFINKTAKYEQARQMDFEMQTNDYKRNAISGSKTTTNPGTRVMQDSGAGELLSVATRPIGKLVGKTAKVAGNVLSGAGDAVSGKLPAISATPTPTRPTTNTMQMGYNLIGQNVGRTEGEAAKDTIQRNNTFKNLEDQLSYNTSGAGLASVPGLIPLNTLAQQQNTVANQAQAQLADIANGMSLALSAGDIDSYNKLASLYQTAYKMYELQSPTTTNNKEVKLSKTQQQANAAALALNELENMNPDFGYAVKDIPLLNLVNATGNKYSSTADSLAMQIGYMLSGANIKEDEAKKIGSAYVPQPFDDEATRKYKLQQARNIIQQYQNTYVTDANNA